MTVLRRAFLLSALLAAGVATAAEDKKADEAKKEVDPNEQALLNYQKQLQKTQDELGKQATHVLLKEVKLLDQATGTLLQTLTVDGDGRVLALLAPARGYGAPVKNAASAVHVLDPDGKPLAIWPVKFHAHSVNAGPDGTVFVAGDGKVARFGKDGKPLGDPVELAHIAEILKDKDGLKAKAEKQIKQQKQAFENSVKQFKTILAKLEAKKEEDLTKTEKVQLKQYRQVMESYKQAEQQYAQMTVESVLEQITGRLRIINGIAVSDQDVFLACGDVEGFGYAVWRLDHDLKNPKKLLSGIGGCCGQMDVQCCGGDLLVAENTKHQYGKYTREGKEIGHYGRMGKETDPGCFGGCCNPMNVRACGGEVFTAESEGVVKKFGPTGEFLGVVGTVKISGGCKNVSIGASKDGDRIYFCDQPGSRVLILARKAAKGEVKKGE